MFLIFFFFNRFPATCFTHLFFSIAPLSSGATHFFSLHFCRSGIEVIDCFFFPLFFFSPPRGQTSLEFYPFFLSFSIFFFYSSTVSFGSCASSRRSLPPPPSSCPLLHDVSFAPLASFPYDVALPLYGFSFEWTSRAFPFHHFLSA